MSQGIDDQIPFIFIFSYGIKKTLSSLYKQLSFVRTITFQAVMVSSFFIFYSFTPFLIWVNMIPISAINNKVNKMANIQKVVTTQPEAMRVMATFVGIRFCTTQG